MKVLFDSAFVIDFLAGLPEAGARHEAIFADGDEPMVNEIVICEVRAGLRLSEAWRLESLLEPVEFIQPGPDAAMRAGIWRAEARTRGHHLSLADSLIAAAADAADAAVLTRNVSDFALTPVRIETY